MTPSERYELDERAAIYEYDAGMTRKDAEARVNREWKEKREMEAEKKGGGK